nr:hypothetical protein [Tanacetum cinerariifolium]
MPPRMTTRSAGRSTAAPRGGRTRGRTGRGGGRIGEPMGRVGGRTGDQDGQGGDQDNRANEGVDKVPDFSTVIAQQLQNLLPTSIDQVGGAIVYTHWTEKMESVHDMSRRGDNQKDKLRVVVFLIFLVGDAWRWFDGIKGSITSWVDLTGNFFIKYYMPSRTGETKNLIIKWDPTNPKFENCDEIKPTNDETFDLEETDHDDEQEIDEIFKIQTNLFDYKTPLCGEFKEFNYLLKIDTDLLTKDIEGFKTYEEFKDDWIYEWNNDVPWVHKKPWTNYGAWNEPTPVTHSLEDRELKEEALRNKSIMKGIINDDDESSYERQKR